MLRLLATGLLRHGAEDVIPEWSAHSEGTIISHEMVEVVVFPDDAQEILGRPIHMDGIVCEQVRAVSEEETSAEGIAVLTDGQAEEGDEQHRQESAQ